MAGKKHYLPQFIGIWAITTVALLAAAGVLVADKNDPAAGGFRLETKVLAGGSASPVSSNVTIFQDGLVFDFLNEGKEVTVLDTHNRQFVVIDPARQIKTVISLDQLLLYGTWLSDAVRRQSDPLLRFCAEPNFETSQSNDGASLEFKSAVMTYSVAAEKPRRADVADSYREFSDWYARLNGLMHPHTLPPFARLVVNERLARSGMIPRRVDLHLAPHARFGGQAVQLQSVHDLSYALNSADKSRTQQARRQLAEFREVALDDYRKMRQ